MIKINLVPQEILAKETQRQQAVQAGIAAAALGVFVAVMTVAHLHAAMSLEGRVKTDQADYDKLKKIVDEVDALKAQADAVQTRLNVIKDLLDGRPLYPHFMLDLAKVVPVDVWFTSVNTTTRGGNQLGVSLTCNAYSADGVVTLVRNMRSSGVFSDPQFSGGLSSNGAGPNKTYSFGLTTSYKSKQH